MDAALYEKLLEELRSDLTETAPVLEEMQSVESFLKRRLDAVKDKASYQNVLDDIAAEIGRRHQTVAELQRIDRYVSGKLGKECFDLKLAPPPQPAEAKPAPAAEKPAGKMPPPKKVKPADDDTKDEPPQDDLSEIADEPSGNTIEFGPDGFPVRSEGPAKKARVPEPANMEQTINFGPDGFPVDFPKPKK